MSKRKTTPQLPSMDDLLGGRPTPSSPKGLTPKSPDSQTPKSQDSKESESRVKVTYYFPQDLVARIDEAHFKLSQVARGSGVRIHKYDMAKIAWELLLDEFEANPEDNPLVNDLLYDS